jgi:hypothetical protein
MYGLQSVPKQNLFCFVSLGTKNKQYLRRRGKPNAYKNHACVYGMQTAQLQHNERKKEPSRPYGNKKVLQILQQTHTTSRNKVRGIKNG